MRKTIWLMALFVSWSAGEGWAMAKKPETQMAPAIPVAQGPATPSPLTLQDCYELALKQSETVALRKEEIERAEAKIFTATSEALGDIDFVMTDTWQEVQKGESVGSGAVGSTFTAQERRERKFVIAQPLFQGFKSLGALTGAGTLRKQRREEMLRAQEILFLEVAAAFYSLLRHQRDVATLERIHGLYEERIKELEERERIGRSRLSEVANARARMKILDADLARARGNFRIARHILEFLTGTEVSAGQLADGELPRPPAEGWDPAGDLIRARPDVEAARQAVKTATRGIVVAQSGLWPEITLENNLYEKREGFQSGIDWDLLIKIDVPLFRGGETVGEIKAAVSEWKKAKFSYSLAQREAELEIKRAYEEWVVSLQESKALDEAVGASEENFQFQKEEYERSLVSNLDVLEALESLQQTRRAALEATYTMKENYWRLAVATGRSEELELA